MRQHIPAARSQDLVVTHALLNNLDGKDIGPTLDESVRVLKAGGEVRHAFCCTSISKEISDLKVKYGSSIEVGY